MVDQLAAQMNGMIVNEHRWFRRKLNKFSHQNYKSKIIHSYATKNTAVQQTTMIVNGKPHVMGSYAVTDDNGLTIMTVYRADDKGFRPITKVSFKKRKDILSLVGK